ncbi:MAG: hypothetical protein JW744_01500 [Candidatus Diapherotrites archaeon]|uniref:Uncharacterized protein n=1 Tax=Candidatus Iainarchaeum sp. TaxID=3101447 RepID=A0A938YS95_9ARCH|nr:hypothetical protein [Candidatus Diapherotrites archaeon]
MAVVANFFGKVVKALPVLALKVGTILLLIFTLGLFSGYLVATMQVSPLVFLIPIVAMFVMWYKLDEGVLVLVFLTLLVVFFPEAVEGIIGGLL